MNGCKVQTVGLLRVNGRCWQIRASLKIISKEVLLLVAVFRIMAAPSDPVQVAVNKALANDPRARDEQIEITRQTLREMGLDPGKNGDLGCLAAQ